MANITEPQAPSLQEIAIEHLTLSHDAYLRALRQRRYTAYIARVHGLTLDQIAETYGVTEGTVRNLIREHERSIADKVL